MAKLAFNSHAHQDIPDSKPHVVTRYNGQILVGGQLHNVEDDEKAWIYDRLDYHAGAHYEGFWAWRSAAIRTTAADLSLEGATYEGEMARILPDTPLRAFWDIKHAVDREGLLWEYRLADAATGLTIAEGEVTPRIASLPGLNPGSYLLWVRIASGARAYKWPHPQYTAITGKSDTPSEYQWIHPTLGTVYYDFIYGVGALPYDLTKDDQRLLLEKRKEVLDNGRAIKDSTFTEDFFTFNLDGTPTARGGEYAVLKVIAGEGEWIGDTEVHVAATPGPALWTVSNQVMTPWMIDPTLRSVGAFYTEPEFGGALWIGGMAAGRSGRMIKLYKVLPEGVSETGMGVNQTTFFYCECALGDESLTSIVRYPDKPLEEGGVIHAISYCEHFEYDAATKTLKGQHPGGRSLVVARKPTGIEGMMFATENDFASSRFHRKMFNHIIYKSAQGPVVGPGTSNHYDSILAVFGGKIWGIEEDTIQNKTPFSELPEERDDNLQFLSWFDGANWQQTARWMKKRFDMGRVARCSNRLLAFGRNNSGRPIAFKLEGSELTYDMECDYHIRRMDSVRWIKEGRPTETMMGIGRKVDAENNLLPGWYIIEGDGKENTVVFQCTEVDENGDCNRWCVPLEEWERMSIDPADVLPSCLNWDGECWKAGECGGNLWLELIITEEAVCYILHGILPYESDIWDGIRWTEGQECFSPENTCPDANCVLDQMPEGTKVGVIRLETKGDLSAFFFMDVSPQRQGSYIARYYPAFWVRVDGQSTLSTSTNPILSAEDKAVLMEFNQRVRYERDTWLEIPARTHIEVCYLIPPNLQIVPALVARY